jgi:hypothetical protein
MKKGSAVFFWSICILVKIMQRIRWPHCLIIVFWRILSSGMSNLYFHTQQSLLWKLQIYSFCQPKHVKWSIWRDHRHKYFSEVTYNMANDYESSNKEMASDSLKWHIKLSPNKKTRAVLLASRVMKFCGLHISWFVALSQNHKYSFLCWHDVWTIMPN